MILAALALAGGILPSTPDLGVVAGRCRSPETGPAFEVEIVGLKDRRGRLKLELYPAIDGDFLADDNVLLAAGKAFARVDVPVPPGTGGVELCIRAPRRGSYALSLLHDRNGDRRFTLATDGIGFANNPHLGWTKPSAAAARGEAADGPRRLPIRLNYRMGLLSFGPARH